MLRGAADWCRADDPCRPPALLGGGLADPISTINGPRGSAGLKITSAAWIIEGTGPGQSKSLCVSGRVALPGGIVARRPIVAAVAFHAGAEFVQRHRAQVRDLLPDHLKRHPNRSLAAFAPDPRIAGGLELGNGAGVGTWRCNQSAVRPARQIILGVGPGTAATTADRGPPVHAPAGFCHSQERSSACLIVFSREHVPACRTRGGRDVNCQEASRAQRFSGEC